MAKRSTIPVQEVGDAQGPLQAGIGLYLGDCLDMLWTLEDDTDGITLIHADPPWDYSGGKKAADRGLAAKKYGGLTSREIALRLKDSYRVAAPNSYLAVWVTLPKLGQFMSTHEWRGGSALIDPDAYLGDWKQVTGGVWGKIGYLGVGYHMRGDAEICLLYKKGSPRARTHSSNLWLEKRRGHSWKSIKAMRTLVELGTGKGGTVLDLFAGDSGDLGRICRILGRSYRGAELDPRRHKAAVRNMSQLELPGVDILPPGDTGRKPVAPISAQSTFIQEGGGL